MPYKIVESNKGFFVEDKKGHKFSKKPLTKPKARKQQIALALNEAKETGKSPGAFFE